MNKAQLKELIKDIINEELHDDNEEENSSVVIKSNAPSEVLNFLKSNMDKKEFSDNARVANVENPQEVKEYIETLKNGCCGYFDQVYVTGNFEVYLVGFNYGH